MIALGHRDGYAPREQDGFHWMLFGASAISGLVGAILLSRDGGTSLRIYPSDAASRYEPLYDSNGDEFYLYWLGFGVSGNWFVTAGILTVLLILFAAINSDLWRRFDYLVWWRQALIFAPVLIASVAILIVWVVVAAILSGLGQEFRAGTGGGQRSRGAVDSSGNVYGWSTWRGEWTAKPGMLGFGQEHGHARRGLMGPVRATGNWGSPANSPEGEPLYERD